MTNAGPVTLYALVGLPGAGKTTRAKELEGTLPALRLTPDEWMLPLFGAYEAGNARDVLEGRLLTLAARAVRLGMHVVLDFGFWSRAERAALRHLASTLGARLELVYLETAPKEQRSRLLARAEGEGAAPRITEADLDEARARFEVPTPDELDGEPGPPPEGFDSWAGWIAWRWPGADTVG
jgi:predicted kinase